MKTDKPNAIIMAAGLSSRFVPLSIERPKGLLEVKGEILIERQIRQLREAGIEEIAVVVGYKSELFEYLAPKFGVDIVMNEDYKRYNNSSSVFRVLDRLGDTYICCSDHYFPENVFLNLPQESFYSALYSQGETDEYCMQTDDDDNIIGVTVGGKDSWYMVGHVYFTKEFSAKFKEVFTEEYMREDVRHGFWEDIYIRNIGNLPEMKIHRYAENDIKEFDSLEDLRKFDGSYIDNTRSKIIGGIARRFNCREGELRNFKKTGESGNDVMFSFESNDGIYIYAGTNGTIRKI